jgi:hypothetical protein
MLGIVAEKQLNRVLPRRGNYRQRAVKVSGDQAANATLSIRGNYRQSR